MANGIERRRAPRAPADFPIRVADRGESRDAKIKDLSTVGLCCQHPEPIGEMTLVGMELDIPNSDSGDHEIHAVQGAVVRCDKLRGQSPPTYEIAVYFTQIEPDTRKAIGSWVEGHLPV